MVKFFKEKVHSENNEWTRQYDKEDETLVFLNQNKTFKKLNKSGGKAKKGVHENVFIRGINKTTPSTMKRYCDDERTQTLLIKTYKIDNKSQSTIEAATNQAKKTKKNNLAYDYVIRNKKKTTNIDVIMPFFEGMDLFTRFNKFLEKDMAARSNRDVHVLLELIIKAIRALEKFHKSGWVHFDIKPENIFIDTKKNIVRIIDVDLARPFAEINNIWGWDIGFSSDYSAPELLAGVLVENKIPIIKDADEAIKADVFSMGMVIVAGLDMFIKGMRYGCEVDICFDRNKTYCVNQLTSMHFTNKEAEKIYALVSAMTADKAAERPSLQEAIAILQPISNRFKKTMKESEKITVDSPLPRKGKRLTL